MAQISYGTITITDTTDLTTYIRYATKAPLTAVSQFQETPTTDTRYIAVLSIPTSDSIPAWNSSSWKWSEFIGTDGLSVKDTRVLYYLKTNSANVPQIDENTPIVSTDTQNVWTSKNPTYVANGTYWTCLEVTLSDNTTKSWSAPAEDLGLTQAAKDAAETKSIAQHANEDAQGALGVARAMQQNFWWWGEEQTVDSSFTLPAGAYTSDIKKDAFKANPTGGYLVTRSDGVYLNNGRYVLMGLTGSALKFYRPGTTKLLSGTETIDAQLDSNGLTLSKGGIKVIPSGGAIGDNNSVYISSDNLGSKVASLVNDNNKTNWRAIIGSKFGVDSEGNLYANEAHISGTFTVKAGSESNIYTKDESDEKVQEEVEKVISVKEASGNIVHVEDASEYPALELTATIVPKQSGTGTPSPDNIRPISGWTEVEASVCGVNVWDEEWEVGTINTSTGEDESASYRIRSKNYIPIKPSTTYYVEGANVGTNVGRACFYDEDKVFVSAMPDFPVGSLSKTFTTPSNAYYMRFSAPSNYGTTYNNDISINYPSTDHDYHAYNGQTHTTSLGRTVYGGLVDVVSGTLTVTHAIVDLGSLSYTYNASSLIGVPCFYATISGIKPGSNNNLSSMFANKADRTYINDSGQMAIGNTTSANYIVFRDDRYSTATVEEFKTAMDGVQLCYELATPQTYQLTPQTINTLAGVNNVWADSGDVYLKYATMNPDMQALMGNATGTKADKTAALSRSQRIYYRSTSIQNSLSGPTTWLSTSGTGYENWSLSIPQLTNGEDSYPYLYTCVQNQTAAQYAAGSDCTCTPVVSDDSTTVIDGGSITTGQILANYIESDGLYINSTQVNHLDELLGDKQDAGDYMTNDEYDDKIKNITALFNTLNGQILFGDDDKNTFILLQNHVKDSPGSVTGIQAKLTSGKLAFGTFGSVDNEVAYFSSEELKVQKRLSFGNFVMKQRDNGHLSIMYEGGDD